MKKQINTNVGAGGLAVNSPPSSKKIRYKNNLKTELKYTFMAGLPFVGFLIFTLFPMGLSFVVSFADLTSYNLSKMQFVGFDNLFKNFKLVLETDITWYALRNSAIYCLSIPLNIGVALMFAHFTSRKMFGTNFVRVVLFIPTICLGTAVAFMWQVILADEVGAINSFIINIFGGDVTKNIGFMSDSKYFMSAIIMISVWRTGTNIIAMQSALASVSPTLKEAARIDGATEMRIFWKIIFPMVTPMLFYMLVMNFIAAMQEQSIFAILTEKTNGLGPGNRGVTLGFQIYRMSFGQSSQYYGMGVGCAMSWMVALLIMVVVKILFKVQNKWVNYETD